MVEVAQENAATQQKPKPKVMFYITGFGKFGPVLENPTTKLVNALPQLLASSDKTDPKKF